MYLLPGDDDAGGRKYVSLLNNSQSHPELTGNKKTTNRGNKTSWLKLSRADRPADWKWPSEAPPIKNKRTILPENTHEVMLNVKVCELLCCRAAEETVKSRHRARQKEQRGTDTNQEQKQETQDEIVYMSPGRLLYLTLFSRKPETKPDILTHE